MGGVGASGSGVAFEALEVGSDLGRALVAQLTILFQSLVDDLFQLGRQIGVDAHGGSRLAVQDGVKDYGGGVAAEGDDAGRHLVEDGSERKQVAAGVEFLALGLFRGHVRDGADGGARTGQKFDADRGGGLSVRACGRRGVGRGRGHFRQAEIENLGVAALGDENVGGLDVAMDDVFAVRGIERIGDFDGQAEQHVHFERAPGDAVLEGQAVEVLHGDESLAIFLANIVNGADVGMVQGGSRLGLTAKTLQRLPVLGDVLREEFQGDEAIEAGVFGLIDDTHAATAKFLDDAVVRDGLADHLLGGRLQARF